MSILDVFLLVFGLLGGGGAAIGVYLKLAEQWLKDKEEQVNELVDAKLFSFIDTLDAICNERSEQNAQDAELPLYSFGVFLESAEEMARQAEEYAAVNGCLYRLSRRVRNGAMFWLYAALFGALATAFFYGDEYVRGFFAIYGVGLGFILFLIFITVALLYASLAIRAILITLSDLNRLDEQSEALLVEPLRSWRKRT